MRVYGQTTIPPVIKAKIRGIHLWAYIHTYMHAYIHTGRLALIPKHQADTYTYGHACTHIEPGIQQYINEYMKTHIYTQRGLIAGIDAVIHAIIHTNIRQAGINKTNKNA